MANENKTENLGKSSAVMTHYNFEMYRNRRCTLTEDVCPMARNGHRLVCNDQDLYIFGGYNPDPAIYFQFTPLFRELWRYNFDSKTWDALRCENIPNAVASSGVILDGKFLLVLGGTSGDPFGRDMNNYLFVCNLESKAPNYIYRFRLVPTTGEKPPPSYGHCMLKDEEYLYTVGGTISYNNIHMNVYRLNLRTKVWEAVFLAKHGDEPKPRYGHECALFNKKIYVFGGCSLKGEVISFEKLPVFDLETFKWSFEKTNGDTSLVKKMQYPEDRKCHGCVQKPGNMAQVFITGGSNAVHHLEPKLKSDCWMIDLNTMTWTRMPSLDLVLPTFCHSSAVTPSGKMYTHGGIICKNDGSPRRTGKMFESWIQIPSLKDMCWEAVLTFIHECVYVGDLMELPLTEEYKRRIRGLYSETMV